MSADPVIYCLEQLTDYAQFERLSSDLMSGVGYVGIEPIGGSGDRGRDALFKDRSAPDQLTVFAYSVRVDWKAKLEQDCKRIRDEEHGPETVVFVCTSTLTSGQKDAAKAHVLDNYGWRLEIYDLERIRVLLATELRHLLAQHPSIFCPPWFPVRGGLSIAQSNDTIVVDHVSADHALATWLSRKLSLAGYRAWCYGTAPLAGEDADSSVRTLIQQRATQYLPILSPAALADANLVGRCGAACEKNDFVTPCWAYPIDATSLSSPLQSAVPAQFDSAWSTGLKQVMDSMESRGVIPALDTTRGRAIALRAYVPESVILPSPEQVVANVFPVSIPKSIIICNLANEMSNEEIETLRRSWAFVIASSTTFLSFDEPPVSVQLVDSMPLPEYAWDSFDWKLGKHSLHVVKELVKRSLMVACFRAGLVWCEDRSVLYFPHTKGPRTSVTFLHLDGRKTSVAVNGEKQYSWGVNATRFRYQLCPLFRVGYDEAKKWWLTMRIYVRVTDLDGTPLQKKEITRKRKTVTSGWWNKEWLARTLGVMQALADKNDNIEIGFGRRRVSVSASPLEWQCPVSIDVEAMDRIGDFQEEMAAMRYSDDEEDALPDLPSEDPADD